MRARVIVALLVASCAAACGARSPVRVTMSATVIGSSHDQQLVRCLVDGELPGVHYAWRFGRNVRAQPQAVDAPTLLVAVSSKKSVEAFAHCTVTAPGLVPIEAEIVLAPLLIRAVTLKTTAAQPATVRFELDGATNPTGTLVAAPPPAPPASAPKSPPPLPLPLPLPELPPTPMSAAYLRASSGRLFSLRACGERSSNAQEFCLPPHLAAGTYHARFVDGDRLVESPTPLVIPEQRG